MTINLGSTRLSSGAGQPAEVDNPPAIAGQPRLGAPGGYFPKLGRCALCLPRRDPDLGSRVVHEGWPLLLVADVASMSLVAGVASILLVADVAYMLLVADVASVRFTKLT